jgi:hypothetical protein
MVKQRERAMYLETNTRTGNRPSMFVPENEIDRAKRAISGAGWTAPAPQPVIDKALYVLLEEVARCGPRKVEVMQTITLAIKQEMMTSTGVRRRYDEVYNPAKTLPVRKVRIGKKPGRTLAEQEKRRRERSAKDAQFRQECRSSTSSKNADSAGSGKKGKKNK